MSDLKTHVVDVVAVLDLLDRDDIGTSPPQIDSVQSEWAQGAVLKTS